MLEKHYLRIMCREGNTKHQTDKTKPPYKKV